MLLSSYESNDLGSKLADCFIDYKTRQATNDLGSEACDCLWKMQISSKLQSIASICCLRDKHHSKIIDYEAN